MYPGGSRLAGWRVWLTAVWLGGQSSLGRPLTEHILPSYPIDPSSLPVPSSWGCPTLTGHVAPRPSPVVSDSMPPGVQILP